MFDAVIEKGRDAIVGLVLGDGICFVAWRPEIVARLMPDGSYDTFAQGPTGPFSVIQETPFLHVQDSTIYATTEWGEPTSSCIREPEQTTWYRYTAPVDQLSACRSRVQKRSTT